MAITIKKYNLSDVKGAREALEKCDCAWNANQDNLITLGGKNVKTHKALLRSDNNHILGIVGKGYTPLQPSFSFSYFDSILDQHNIKWSEGIVLNEGSKIILKANFPDKVLIRVGDECVKQFVLINSFDMSSSFEGHLDMERLACTNGMRSHFKENQFSCRHTTNGRLSADIALKMFSQSINYFETFETQCKQLAQIIADKEMVNNFLSEMFDKKTDKKEKVSTHTKNQKKEVVRLFKHGAGNNGSSAWDLYNGFTEWVDHNRTSNADKRMVSALIGGGATLKQKAFKTLTEIF